MTDLPLQWRLYAEYQSKLAQSHRIDNGYWGLENALNRSLSTIESSAAPQSTEDLKRELDTALSTGAWVERNHARLRRKYLCPEANPPADRQVMARVRLGEIRRQLGGSDWKFLLTLTLGLALSGVSQKKNGAIRTRLARIRAQLRDAE